MCFNMLNNSCCMFCDSAWFRAHFSQRLQWRRTAEFVVCGSDLDSRHRPPSQEPDEEEDLHSNTPKAKRTLGQWSQNDGWRWRRRWRRRRWQQQTLQGSLWLWAQVGRHSPSDTVLMHRGTNMQTCCFCQIYKESRTPDSGLYIISCCGAGSTCTSLISTVHHE